MLMGGGNWGLEAVSLRAAAPCSIEIQRSDIRFDIKNEEIWLKLSNLNNKFRNEWKWNSMVA